MSKNNSIDKKVSDLEMSLVKRDFIKAVIIDLMFLCLLLGLYYANQSYGFIDKFLERL